MITAIEIAKKALKDGEVPIGAVIVDGATGEIIASAGNETEQSNDPTAHAEILAIKKACEIKNSPRIPECDLYVTLEPCPMCATAISFARIRRVYFGAYDPKGGGVDHGARIFNQPTCHHKPEVYGGIYEQECAQILKDFFKSKR
ncbi:MAG: nucleoside deaminase [Proteobacteria bacterium]|nr:nucleoside deaminase [Pseudomonadota bacterium]